MKSLFLKLKSPFIALFGYLASGALFAAANAQNLPTVPITSYQGLKSSVLCKVAGAMFDVCMALTVIFVVFAAYKYLTSSGDPEKVRSATKTFTYAAVAVVVALLAKNLPAIIASIFGASGSVSGC